MTLIRDVMAKLESFAPLSLQESYDNSGLLAGIEHNRVKGVLICIDVTEEVVLEAVKLKCNLIISHHPLIFEPIRKLTGETYVQRALLMAIRHDIAIYAMHTNLDNAPGGVSSLMADKLKLKNKKILRPGGQLSKIVTFCPDKYCGKVRDALFDAGAGHIGHYDRCSFNSEGYGTFRGDSSTKPFVGQKNLEHREEEVRIEIIFHQADRDKVVKALLQSHPYEEPAYDIYTLENKSSFSGAGIIGELEKAVSITGFLRQLRNTFKIPMIRYTKGRKNKIRKVALCGGSGAFLLTDAMRKEADIFVTADIKYHQFFDASDEIILADIGHFESEQYAVEIIADLLKENFSTFATCFSGVKTNPIKYF